MSAKEKNKILTLLRVGSAGAPPLGAGRSPTDELGRKLRMTQFILRAQ